MMLAVYSLWRRDVIRFLRQPSRIIGALLTPVIFWFVIGSGLGSSFEGGFLPYYFPGSLALIVLFTAIFSTISNAPTSSWDSMGRLRSSMTASSRKTPMR